MSCGVRRSRKRYMTSRQVQKLSSVGPRRSASPAMPRWKVWLCRFGSPGTAAPAIRLASPVRACGSTIAITPPSIRISTFSRQPSGNRAVAKCSLLIGVRMLLVRAIVRGAIVQVDRLWRNARLATMAPGRPGLGLVEAGAIAARDGRIAWTGPEDEIPDALEARETVDCSGRWITPGLIDCHTHLVFAGDRSDEFERRLGGESYADIARRGGGIAATVRATRAASEDDLVRSAVSRLDALLAEGVTTVEIKSGYGLETEAELRQLRAARRLGEERPVAVAPTYLGAHAVPPGGDRAAYV